jgi:hypothetical protein
VVTVTAAHRCVWALHETPRVKLLFALKRVSNTVRSRRARNLNAPTASGISEAGRVSVAITPDPAPLTAIEAGSCEASWPAICSAVGCDEFEAYTIDAGGNARFPSTIPPI